MRKFEVVNIKDRSASVLPDKAMDNHIAILGKTGSGKTYTAKGLVERLLEKKKRVCIIDPTGVWWGLKSTATGKEAAFPIVIFGGDRADFPIGRDHGAAIAEIIAGTDTPAIIDTGLMSVGDRTRFFTDFAETLLRKNREPLNLVIDEAHNFMPQGKVPDPQAGKMLHAGNNLVSMGRARGLQIMMVSQRPQKLHKDSLTQAATLIAMQVIHPLDRKAVQDWIGENADLEQGRELVKSLASLKKGQGWVWSPDFGILEQASFPKIKTYDSSSAPTGERKSIKLSSIDMDAITKKLEAAAVSVIEDDPKRLRAKIADLERKLKTAPAAVPAAEIEAAKAEAFEHGRAKGFVDGHNAATDHFAGILKNNRLEYSAGSGNAPMPRAEPKPMRSIPSPVKAKVQPAGPATGGEISGGERKILTALAMYPQGRSKNQVGVLSGYKVGGGGFNNYLSGLRTKGFIEGGGQRITITDAGLSALGPFDPLPTGNDLIQYWLGQLDKAQSSILSALIDVYPKQMDKAALGAATGYEPGGGGFNNALSRLRTLELIEGRGEMKASDDFFQ
jgi:uncharacterized protein